MKRLIVGLLLLGGAVALPSQAELLIIEDCTFCVVSGYFSGFGDTNITARADAYPVRFPPSGSGQVLIDFRGYTTGPVRDGFIYMFASADSDGLAAASIDVDGYECAGHSGSCGPISDRYLPITLGTEFDIKMDAGFFGLGAAGARLQFSMYEDVGGLVGSPVIISEAPDSTPEPSSLSLSGGVVGIFALAGVVRRYQAVSKLNPRCPDLSIILLPL